MIGWNGFFFKEGLANEDKWLSRSSLKPKIARTPLNNKKKQNLNFFLETLSYCCNGIKGALGVGSFKQRFWPLHISGTSADTVGRADLGRYLFSQTLVVEGFKVFLSTSYFAFSFAVFFSFFNLFAFPENICTPPTPMEGIRNFLRVGAGGQWCQIIIKETSNFIGISETWGLRKNPLCGGCD